MNEIEGEGIRREINRGRDIKDGAKSSDSVHEPRCTKEATDNARDFTSMGYS
jgi:hypothetical protein